MDSLIAAAQCIKKSGAKKIFVIATHAPLSGESPKKLQDSCIDQVIETELEFKKIYLKTLMIKITIKNFST